MLLQSGWRALNSRRFGAVKTELRRMATCVVCLQENAFQNSRCVCGAATCRSCTIKMKEPEKCPVCRQRRLLTANDCGMRRLYLATDLKLECGHCGRSVDALWHAQHTERCGRRVHECPLAGCSYRGVPAELHAHLVNEHDAPLLEREPHGYGTTILFTPAVQGVVVCLDNGAVVIIDTVRRSLVSMIENGAGSPIWVRLRTIYPRPGGGLTHYAVEQYDVFGKLVDKHALNEDVSDFACIPRSCAETTVHHGTHAPDGLASSREKLVSEEGLRSGDLPVPVALLTFQFFLAN